MVACRVCCKFAVALYPDSTHSSKDKYLLPVIQSSLISIMMQTATLRSDWSFEYAPDTRLLRFSSLLILSTVYITEPFPPFSYQEDGKLQGISVDLLEKMLVHMNMTLNRSEIKLLPWDQGYQMALRDNNTIIFSTGRIPERETLFKWAGPISSIKVVLFALNEKRIKINSPGDLRALKIGVVKDSAEGPLVIKAGALVIG